MGTISFTDRLIATGIPLNYAEAEMRRQFGDVHDAPSRIFEGRRGVGMLFTSRSGTTFLVDIINKTGRLGRILEHFNPYRIDVGVEKWGVTSADEYVGECVRRHSSDDGVFGFKGTVEALLPLVQVNELPSRARDWTWITVRRDDTVAQAISLLRAKSSAVWHDRGQLETPAPVPEYDFGAILKQFNIIQRKQGQIERFFAVHGIEPLRLVYEDFQDDPVPALHQVFDHVGIPAPKNLQRKVENSKFRVMRNSETEAMRSRFSEELAERLQVRVPTEGNPT